MKSMVAFLNKPEHIPRVIRTAKNLMVNKITLISEDPLIFNSDPAFLEMSNKELCFYKPSCLDQLVAGRLSSFFRAWGSLNKTLFKQLVWERVNFAKTATYPLWSLLHPPLRTALTMKNAISYEMPDYVMAFSPFDKLSTVAGIKTIAIKPINTVTLNKIIRISYAVIWVIVAIILRLVIPVLKAHTFNGLTIPEIKKYRTIVIGRSYQAQQIGEIWEQINETKDNVCHLLPPIISIKQHEVVHCLMKQRQFLAILIVFHKFIRCILTYLKFIYIYIKLIIYDNHKNEVYQSFMASFDKKLDCFIIMNLPTALLCISAADSLSDNSNVDTAVLLTPNTWGEASMGVLFKRKGVRCISFTHGMVLDPIDYRSNLDLKFVWSAFDAKVLRRFSDDTEIVPLISQLPEFPPCPHLPEKDEGNIALLLPSLPHSFAVLSSFIAVSLKFIQKNKLLFGIQKVIIKPHPRANRGDLSGAYSVIKSMSSAQCPVFVLWNGDLPRLVKESKVVFCTPSSVMIECLKQRIPFFVYIKYWMGSDEFLSELPDWMKYKSDDDLEKTFNYLSLSQVNQLINKVCQRYWKDN